MSQKANINQITIFFSLSNSGFIISSKLKPAAIIEVLKFSAKTYVSCTFSRAQFPHHGRSLPTAKARQPINTVVSYPASRSIPSLSHRFFFFPSVLQFQNLNCFFFFLFSIRKPAFVNGDAEYRYFDKRLISCRMYRWCKITDDPNLPCHGYFFSPCSFFSLFWDTFIFRP